MDLDSAAPGQDTGSAALIDVTGMPLDQLLSSSDSALANSICALVDDLSRPQEIIAAFGNFAPDDNPAPAC